MAVQLIFRFRGEDSACHLSKVDRSKLYSRVEREVRDEDGEKCREATLAADGQTLIGSGGTSSAYFSADGLWLEKKDLRAVNLENATITPVASSFKAPVELSTEATPEDYLSHNIRAVYVVDSPEGFPDALVKELEAGKICHFPFSYRGGLDPDEGFLFQGQDGTKWLAFGKPAVISMVGLAQGTAEEPGGEEEAEEELDLMDFDIM